MAKQLQLRRGTTAQHSTFTGAAGEVTIDTDKKVVVVHDGSTAGGTPLAKDSAKVDKVTSTDNAIVRFDGTSGAVQNSSVVIDDSGNVGIGTSSPASLLTVNTRSSSSQSVRITDDTGYIVIGHWDGTNNRFEFSGKPTKFMQYGTGNGFYFGTNGSNTTGVSIDSSGNVGIGTSSPSNRVSVGGTDSNALVSSANSISLTNVQGASSNKGSMLKFYNDYRGNNYTAGIGGGLVSSSSTGSTGYLSFFTKGSESDSVPAERMRIDSSGNVGIGVTPSAWATSKRAIDGYGGGLGIASTTNETNYTTNCYLNSNSSAWIYKTNNPATLHNQYNGLYSWYTAPSGTAGNAITWTEAMTLGDNGLTVNKTITGYQPLVLAKYDSSNYVYMQGRNTVDTTEIFLSLIGGVKKSAILANGTFQSATNSYGSTSDAKLKENIVDTTPKLDKLMQVQVRNFNYIGEEQKQIGVVAQEIEKIFPSIVYETKDTKQVEVEKERVIPAIEEVTEQKLITEAVLDEEGNVITEAVYETVVVQEAKPESIEKYTETETVETGEVTKNVKYSVIYMMMLKGMQEQQQIIDDLKARIEALEDK